MTIACHFFKKIRQKIETIFFMYELDLIFIQNIFFDNFLKRSILI